MIELRWKVQADVKNARPILQYRQAGGDWIDVPTELVTREPGERANCCDGGPQWGHAWSCPNAQ